VVGPAARRRGLAPVDLKASPLDRARLVHGAPHRRGTAKGLALALRLAVAPVPTLDALAAAAAVVGAPRLPRSRRPPGRGLRVALTVGTREHAAEWVLLAPDTGRARGAPHGTRVLLGDGAPTVSSPFARLAPLVVASRRPACVAQLGQSSSRGAPAGRRRRSFPSTCGRRRPSSSVAVLSLSLELMRRADLDRVVEIERESFSMPCRGAPSSYEIEQNRVARCWVCGRRRARRLPLPSGRSAGRSTSPTSPSRVPTAARGSRDGC